MGVSFREFPFWPAAPPCPAGLDLVHPVLSERYQWGGGMERTMDGGMIIIRSMDGGEPWAGNPRFPQCLLNTRDRLDDPVRTEIAVKLMWI